MKVIFSILLLVVGIFLGQLFQLNKLSAQILSFEHVVPFSTPGGLQGFFDQKKGLLYYYDQNMEKCLFTFQVQELGEEIKRIK